MALDANRGSDKRVTCGVPPRRNGHGIPDTAQAELGERKLCSVRDAFDDPIIGRPLALSLH